MHNGKNKIKSGPNAFQNLRNHNVKWSTTNYTVKKLCIGRMLEKIPDRRLVDFNKEKEPHRYEELG